MGLSAKEFRLGVSIAPFLAMHALFQSFYIEVYTIYGITEAGFMAAQTAYMIWNTINDPLFGYLVQKFDNPRARHVAAIKYGGPVFSLCLMLPFFPWGEAMSPTLTAVHMATALSLWDTFFTYVVEEHRALVDEAFMADAASRGRANLCTYVMGALTQPTGLALASSCFDKDNLGPFRRLIVTVSLSTAAFWYVSYRLVKPYAIDSTRTLSGRFDQGPEPLPPLRTVCGQLLSYRNFQSYVWAAFLMAACSTVANDFLRLVVGELVDGGAVARLAPISQPIAGMVGMLFKILLLRTSPSTTWRVALCVTLVTCGAALAAQLSVPEAAAPSSQATGWMWWKQPKAAPVEPPIFSSLSPQLAAFVPLLAPLLFFVPGGAFGRDEAKSDLIAEDLVLFSRPTPLSSFYNGVSALITKPAQSLGPMLIVRLRAAYPTRRGRALVWYGFFFGASVLQLLVLSFYDLSGSKLARVRLKLAGLKKHPNQPKQD